MEQFLWFAIRPWLCPAILFLVPLGISYPFWLWRERRIRHPRPLPLEPGEFVVHSLMTFSYGFRIRGLHLEHDDAHHGKLILTNRRLLYTSRTQRHQLWELFPADLLKWDVRGQGARWDSPALRIGYRRPPARWFKHRPRGTRVVEWQGSLAELEAFSELLTRWKAGRPLTPAVSPSPPPQTPEVPPVSIPPKPPFVKPAWRISQLITAMQVLLVAEIALTVIDVGIEIAEESVVAAIRPDLVANQQQQGAGAAPFAAEAEASEIEIVVGLVLIVLFLGLLALLISSWVGLFLLRPWAPWLYLSMTVVGSVLGLLGGLFDVAPHWGLSSWIGGVGGQVSGALLALIFLTPLAQQFQSSTTTA